MDITINDSTGITTYYCYSLQPIDFDWEMVVEPQRTIPDRVRALAMLAGWEGDVKQVGVFWIPKPPCFVPGWVIKQENGGGTFVVSPVELLHLYELGM